MKNSAHIFALKGGLFYEKKWPNFTQSTSTHPSPPGEENSKPYTDATYTLGPSQDDQVNGNFQVILS